MLIKVFGARSPGVGVPPVDVLPHLVELGELFAKPEKLLAGRQVERLVRGNDFPILGDEAKRQAAKISGDFDVEDTFLNDDVAGTVVDDVLPRVPPHFEAQCAGGDGNRLRRLFDIEGAGRPVFLDLEQALDVLELRIGAHPDAQHLRGAHREHNIQAFSA